MEGYGNSNSPKQYSYTDSNPIGGSKFHYRLKQIDNNGQFEFSDVVEIELRPEQYVLYQNYPNPFNPVTKIRYSVPQLSNVVIEIIDRPRARAQHRSSTRPRRRERNPIGLRRLGVTTRIRGRYGVGFRRDLGNRASQCHSRAR